MNEKLIDFLYILLRDHLPAGEVEGIVVQHVEAFPRRERDYSNPYLAEYARELASRLS